MCKYWAGGACVYGDGCINVHVYNEGEVELCTYYSSGQGECKKSEVRTQAPSRAAAVMPSSLPPPVPHRPLPLIRLVSVSALGCDRRRRLESRVQVVRPGFVPQGSGVQEATHAQDRVPAVHVWLLPTRNAMSTRTV